MKRVLILAASVALIGAAPAHAGVVTGGTLSYQRWVDESLMPTPPNPITVVEQDCPTEPGRACTGRDRPIYMGNENTYGSETPEGQHYVFMHELGHQFDWQVLTSADRQVMGAVLGLSSVGGWDQERFADAYALCATGDEHDFNLYGYDYNSAATARLVCPMIEAAPTPVPPHKKHKRHKKHHRKHPRRRVA